MKSAAAYTNKRRVMAEAGNVKVQQIGNIATNYGPLQPVLPSQASPLTVTACGPNFTEYNYFKGCRTLKNHDCSKNQTEWIASSSNVKYDGNYILGLSNITKLGGSNSAFDEGAFTISNYSNFTVTFKVGTNLQETPFSLGTIQRLWEDTKEARIYSARYAFLFHTAIGGFVECYSADTDTSYASTTYNTNNVFKIVATPQYITFYKDDTYMYRMVRVTSEPLYINISLYRLGSSFKDIKIT